MTISSVPWNPINVWQIKFIVSCLLTNELRTDLWLFSTSDAEKSEIVGFPESEVGSSSSVKMLIQCPLLTNVLLLDALSWRLTKFSWRRGSYLTTSGSLKMDSCLVLKVCLIPRIPRFRTSAIYLFHSERMSTSTFSFFAQRLAYSSHTSIIISKLWYHGYETGPVFSALAQKISKFHITYYIEITCHYMAMWSVQKL